MENKYPNCTDTSKTLKPETEERPGSWRLWFTIRNLQWRSTSFFPSCWESQTSDGSQLGLPSTSVSKGNRSVPGQSLFWVLMTYSDWSIWDPSPWNTWMNSKGNQSPSSERSDEVFIFTEPLSVCPCAQYCFLPSPTKCSLEQHYTAHKSMPQSLFTRKAQLHCELKHASLLWQWTLVNRHISARVPVICQILTEVSVNISGYSKYQEYFHTHQNGKILIFQGSNLAVGGGCQWTGLRSRSDWAHWLIYFISWVFDTQDSTWTP